MTHTSKIISRAKIRLPRTGSPRNILENIDNIGFYHGLNRELGEPSANFRLRVGSSFIKRPNSTECGLIDAICAEFGLGHEIAMTVTANEDVFLDILPFEISISGASGATKIRLVESDQTSYWMYPTMNDIASAINSTSNVSATVVPIYSELPGILLERQSSYIPKVNEVLPNATSFILGMIDVGLRPVGKILPDTIDFADTNAFKTMVSGLPTSPGEWSIDQNTFQVNVFSLPNMSNRVSYTYNLLTSGRTMNLIANGTKIISLSDRNVQDYSFVEGGIPFNIKRYLRKINNFDRGFWDN